MPVTKFTPLAPPTPTQAPSRVVKFTPLASETDQPEPATPEPPEPVGGTVDAGGRTWLDPLGDVVKGAWSILNPVTAVKGLGQLVQHPVDTFKGIGQAQGDLAYKAKDAFDRGDHVAGVRHALEYLIPVLGPAMSHAGDLAEQGKVAEGIGEAIGIGLGAKGVNAVPKNVVAKFTAPLRNVNPVERAAVEFGIQRGVPVDAATATSNPVVRGAQKLAEHTTLAGSWQGGRAVRQQVGAMTRLGEELVERAHPAAAMVPETAGASVVSGVESTIAGLKGQADTAYEAFRAVASNPKYAREVQIGTREVTRTRTIPGQTVRGAYGEVVSTAPDRVITTTTQVPVMKTVELPVDMRSIKAALQPLYEDMKTWMEPARRNASAGYQAIRSIVEGEDYLPAATAERGLGGIKSMAREARSENLRDFNQGVAARASARLQASIDKAVAGAGPDALKELHKARASHAAKMRAADVLGQLRSEPVQVFNQATQAMDSGIERLRAVAKLAPQEMPKIGRAYLDQLVSSMTAEGGLSHAQRAASQWAKLGPETKRILFRDAGHVRDLDRFFTLAKKMTENPNPSGSGYIVGLSAHLGGLTLVDPVTHLVYELSGAAVSKLLRSPVAARALTNGMTMRLGIAPKAVATAAAVLRFAGDDAISTGITQPLRPEHVGTGIR